jgi:hypothetical protein
MDRKHEGRVALSIKALTKFVANPARLWPHNRPPSNGAA